MTFGTSDEKPAARDRGARLDRRQFLRGSAALAAAGAAAGATPATMAAGADAPAATGTARIVINGLDTSDVTAEFLGLLRQGGVHCSHVSKDDAYSYGSLLRFVDRHPKEVAIAKTTEAILQAKRDGKIALVCGSQAASDYIPQLFPEGVRKTYETVAVALRVNYELGMRTQGIAYNTANIFGGGCLEPRSPLTRVGRRLVEEIHKLRILLDVGGHTGEQTSLDALAMSGGVPVVCTHTNIAALKPNPRATSDRVLEAIARSGGVIGLTAISDFLVRDADAKNPRSPQATLEMLLDQYDYLKRLVGIDHIGLGTDHIWGWGNEYVHAAEDNILFPPDTMSDGPSQLVKDFENVAKLPNLERGLLSRGWRQAELDQLMGANWLRIYKAAWGA